MTKTFLISIEIEVDNDRATAVNAAYYLKNAAQSHKRYLDTKDPMSDVSFVQLVRSAEIRNRNDD